VSRPVVALETSSRSSSVAVRLGDREVAVELEAGRAHASDLLPALDRILRDLGARPAEIEAVLVGTGPGSYTGLRVGIATALGIARGSGARLRGVPSGETLCFAELRPGEEGSVLLDARSGEIYLARYRRTPEDVDVLHPPCVLRPEEVAALIPGDGPIFGDGEAAAAAGLLPQSASRLRSGARPSARALLDLGSRRLERLGGMAPAEVAPLYLRPFAVRARRR
jgi:tRNA threonylcarbamoyladenosine biosynthesis protein TsaB